MSNKHPEHFRFYRTVKPEESVGVLAVRNTLQAVFGNIAPISSVRDEDLHCTVLSSNDLPHLRKRPASNMLPRLPGTTYDTISCSIQDVAVLNSRTRSLKRPAALALILEPHDDIDTLEREHKLLIKQLSKHADPKKNTSLRRIIKQNSHKFHVTINRIDYNWTTDPKELVEFLRSEVQGGAIRLGPLHAPESFSLHTKKPLPQPARKVQHPHVNSTPKLMVDVRSLDELPKHPNGLLQTLRHSANDNST